MFFTWDGKFNRLCGINEFRQNFRILPFFGCRSHHLLVPRAKIDCSRITMSKFIPKELCSDDIYEILNVLWVMMSFNNTIDNLLKVEISSFIVSSHCYWWLHFESTRTFLMKSEYLFVGQGWKRGLWILNIFCKAKRNRKIWKY